MVASTDISYPAALRGEDRRRGRDDGNQRIPALSEVRRQQQELTETGGQPRVGYQLVLLAELDQEVAALSLAQGRTGRTASLELRQHDERIAQAQRAVRRAEERHRESAAELTPEELRPRNPEEERWTAETLRHRREVARARRIAAARAAYDLAERRLEQRQTDRVDTVRRHEEETVALAVRVRGLVELYQRRMAEYLDALAGAHPDGKTLYPLLTVPEIPLPDWVTRALAPNPPESWSEP